MARNLHTASKYQIKYTQTIIPGGESQGAFYHIFQKFNILSGQDDECTDEFEVPRDELEELRNHIANRTDYFEERKSWLENTLESIGLTIEQFLVALNQLITASDQSCPDVLLSWY